LKTQIKAGHILKFLPKSGSVCL